MPTGNKKNSRQSGVRSRITSVHRPGDTPLTPSTTRDRERSDADVVVTDDELDGYSAHVTINSGSSSSHLLQPPASSFSWNTAAPQFVPSYLSEVIDNQVLGEVTINQQGLLDQFNQLASDNLSVILGQTGYCRYHRRFLLNKGDPCIRGDRCKFIHDNIRQRRSNQVQRVCANFRISKKNLDQLCTDAGFDSGGNTDHYYGERNLHFRIKSALRQDKKKVMTELKKAGYIFNPAPYYTYKSVVDVPFSD